MNYNINNLQDSINTNTIGVIWITQKPLNSRPQLFDELDYFTNGLLTNFQQQQQRNKSDHPLNRKNFFASMNFGSPFFISHIEEDEQHIRKDIEEIILLVKPLAHDDHSILVLDFSSKDYTKVLNKRYSDLNFINL